MGLLHKIVILTWGLGILMKNGFDIKNWKALFFALLGFNLIFIFWILLLIFLPFTPKEPIPQKPLTTEEVAQFTISSSKQNLNKLVNTYLEELSNHTKIEYSVTIDNYVTLVGSIVAFERDIPLTVRFDPEVQKNGDLNLRVQSISLGRLELPNKRVLEYVKKNYPMPEWVIVNPAAESIYAAVTKMEMRSNFDVSVESFNLRENDLAFRITVPNKAFDLRKAF
jgi:uncharacterized protein YpmS